MPGAALIIRKLGSLKTKMLYKIETAEWRSTLILNSTMRNGGYLLLIVRDNNIMCVHVHLGVHVYNLVMTIM